MNARFFAVLALCSLLCAPSPVRAGLRPSPPQSCTAPSLPEPVATRFAQLGGIDRFGCPIDTSGPVYAFRNGQIEAAPRYGTRATYAAIVDASRIVHLYFEGGEQQYPFDRYLVRLTFEGSLVNQARYDAGNGDVGGTYASNILVHPGDRHGTFEIALEGCLSGGVIPSTCLGWGGAVLRMNL